VQKRKLFKLPGAFYCYMPSSLLFPLNQIKPTQILSEYAEWIYFTLILVFFISVAGITLRKHFDRPYIKPLIISVGLMLTVGVFMFKNQLVMIFEGWGILGLVLLVFLVATIPFGLCRGYGMPTKKAVYLTYILIYIVAWFKFPVFFYSLANRNLGLVNLGLLILFFVAVFKMIPLDKTKRNLARDIVNSSPFKPEIMQNMQMQNKEKKLVKDKSIKITKFEIRTIRDIAEALAEIQRMVETNKNQLSRPEREKIASILQKLPNNENIFKKGLWNLQKIFQQINTTDVKQLENLKECLKKASEKEKQILKVEIEQEEEKLKIEKTILDLEERLNQYIDSFNKFLEMAMEVLGKPEHLSEVKDNLAKTRVILNDITEMLKITTTLEKKIVSLTKTEQKLLKKEKESA
jgi:hypothetical protein